MTKEMLKIFSKRVKMVRLKHNVSQSDMAKAIGTSQTNLSNMEAGRTAITMQNLFKIQKVLGCKMADFFVDFDGNDVVIQREAKSVNCFIEVDDAVSILKLLKSVTIKGL